MSPAHRKRPSTCSSPSSPSPRSASTSLPRTFPRPTYSPSTPSSKDFHRLLNTSHTAYILASARTHAPLHPLPGPPCALPTYSLPVWNDAVAAAEARRTRQPLGRARLFTTEFPHQPSWPRTTDLGPPSAADILPFTLWKRLTIADPLGHLPGHTAPKVAPRPDNRIVDPTGGRAGRLVPSFKYLFRIVFLARAVRATLALLWRQHGLCVPRGSQEAMLKMAFLAHVRRNSTRTGLAHNAGWLTDRELWLGLNVTMRVDMALMDLGVAQRVWVEYCYEPTEGVRVERCGWRVAEVWGGSRVGVLMGVEEGLVREAAKRQLHMGEWVMSMLVGGFEADVHDWGAEWAERARWEEERYAAEVEEAMRATEAAETGEVEWDDNDDEMEEDEDDEESTDAAGPSRLGIPLDYTPDTSELLYWDVESQGPWERE